MKIYSLKVIISYPTNSVITDFRILKGLLNSPLEIVICRSDYLRFLFAESIFLISLSSSLYTPLGLTSSSSSTIFLSSLL